MTRKEAIEIIKRNCTSDSDLRKACELFIPELVESEDERVRKALIQYLKDYSCYLPKGLYSRDDFFTYLEKQKDVSKAIEAVDRIDKYIDEHVANAHDMKDSNPDKKYYLGWDDALAKMSGILQDVYSDEKQKEQKPPIAGNDFGWIDELKHDLKHPEELDEKVQEVLKKRQKPVERSLEDDHIIGFVYDLLNEIEWKDNWAMSKEECLGRLKSLRPQKKTYDGPWRSFTEKEDAAEEYVIQAARYPVKESEYLADLEDAFTSGVEWKEKRGWKPSKEQIGALDYAYCELFKRKGVGHIILGPLQKLCDELKKQM